MKKMVIYVLILFGIIFGIKIIHAIIRKYEVDSRLRHSVTTISAMQVQPSTWQPTITAVGSSRTYKGVNVTTELGGMITAIKFTPGQYVKQGDLLVQLDISTDVAKLHALQAQALFAKITYERNLKQYKAGAISQETLAGDEAQYEATAADVVEQEATIEKKTIHAPFSGKLGISMVNLGQYINPGDTIVNLQTLSPIWVDFYLPQQQLRDVQLGEATTVTVDTYPGQHFSGKITTISPMVDADVRNVEVEATLPNQDQKILPGMFVNVSLNRGASRSYMTLPQTAISFNPYVDVVFVLKKTDKSIDKQTIWQASQSIVTVGATRGEQISVLKGLKTGDMVVTSGQLKLTNGSMVVINNSLAPSNSPHAKGS
jgi:membrane fusion protein (multidrug efflux system)